MSAEIAPWGERKLQEVLIRLAGAAKEAENFLQRKLDPWEKPSQQAELIPDLWNGREPRFTGLMQDFRVAMQDLRSLARENEDAETLLYSIQPLEWNRDIAYVRGVLKTTFRVVNAYLAAHPIREVRPLGIIACTTIIAFGYVHHVLWILGGRKMIHREKKDD